MPASRSLALGLGLLLSVGLATAEGATVTAPPGTLAAIVEYGRTNLDEGTGLIRDAWGRPNLVDSSIGFTAAALAGEQADRQLGLRALQAILDNQDTQAGSKSRGEFRWTCEPGAAFSPDAALYVAPLLAYTHVTYGTGVLGPQLDQRLVEALRQALLSLQRRVTDKEDGTTRLMRAAALATIGRALEDRELVKRGAALVAAWGAQARRVGDPEGHSPTYDALRIGAVRWVIWAGGTGVEEPHQLLWLDFVQRVDVTGAILAGAIRTAFPGDYLNGESLARDLAHRDLASAAPSTVRPLAAYLLLTPPAEIGQFVHPQPPWTVTTAADDLSGITHTDTFIGPDFTLGTISGAMDDNAILALASYTAGGPRPTSYFYLRGGPASISSVQSGGTAIVSASFDGVGQGQRRQVSLGILGTKDQIERTLLFGQRWPGQEVAMGEMSVLALQTRNCYVAIRPLHCGPAKLGARTEGLKAGRLDWVGSGNSAELRLRIYARQDETTLPKPGDDYRAGFLIRVEPLSAFPTLEDFSQAVSRTRMTQIVTLEKIRMRDLENQEKPPILTEDKPHSSADMVFKYLLRQKIDYAAEDLSLGLEEDLLAGETLSRSLNGKPMADSGPWSSPQLNVPWPPGRLTGPG